MEECCPDHKKQLRPKVGLKSQRKRILKTSVEVRTLEHLWESALSRQISHFWVRKQKWGLCACWYHLSSCHLLLGLWGLCRFPNFKIRLFTGSARLLVFHSFSFFKYSETFPLKFGCFLLFRGSGPCAVSK